MIELAATVELSFKLAIPETKQTVDVVEETPLVDTQASEIGHVIDEKAISELPINGRRFSDLTLLAPGVTQDPRGLTSSANGDLAFGGVRGFRSTILVDGADNNNSFFAQGDATAHRSNSAMRSCRVPSLVEHLRS